MSAFPELWSRRLNPPEFKALLLVDATKQCGFLLKASAWALNPAKGTKSYRVESTSVTSMALERPTSGPSLRASWPPTHSLSRLSFRLAMRFTSLVANTIN